MATMGGLWQAAVMGFAGIRRLRQALIVDPHLPASWRRFSVPLWFREARVQFEITQFGGAGGAAARVDADPSSTDDPDAARDGTTPATVRLGITVEHRPLRVLLDDVERELTPGRYAWRRVGRGPWQEEQ
jgi:cellobiose phosphorylase